AAQAAADEAAAAQAAADEAAAAQAAADEAAAEAYTISGMVVDAETGTGIAALTINLEQPAGTIINSVETAEDGSYSFADLMAGQYIVSVETAEGWETIEPAVVDLAENAVQDFTATKIPVAMPPVDVPADMPPAIA
ncbi:MAG: carboxypeptidase regulatory-like domain-containing protein, partial [Methanotrichaceae archaeon]|nr:carboxypeptidase regulatory-like domain-containing protein [Methanotrichaceae archaeon]